MAMSKMTRLICMQVWIGIASIFALVTFIILIVHLAHNSHSGPDRHVFCVAHEDDKTYFGGKVEVFIEDNQLCVDFVYVNTVDEVSGKFKKRIVVIPDDDFCIVDSIELKGPVMPFYGPPLAETLVPIVEEPLEESSGRITYKEDSSKCFHVAGDTLRILLQNPALVFVQYNLTGQFKGEDCATPRNLYLTSMCQDSEFELSDIDDDDGNAPEDHGEQDDDGSYPPQQQQKAKLMHSRKIDESHHHRHHHDQGEGERREHRKN